MSKEQRTSAILRFLIRIAMNIGMVVFLQRSFPAFFLLEGGPKAIVIVGLTLAFLNWMVVPILHILSLPIKFFAWIVAFLLVNVVTIWIAVWFVTALQIEGFSLTVGGGVIGWLTLSFILGFGNWLVRAILK